MNVFIAFASYDSMKMHTAFALAQTARILPCAFSLNMQRGPYTHWNREKLLKDALEGDHTHLMFIDCDVVFPPDGVQRLLSLDKDIVGGAYNMRKVPPPGSTEVSRTTAVKLLGGKKRFPTTDSPFRVDAVPTGFMLIRLDAIRGLPQPWFFFDQDEEGFVGEDVFFCRKVRDHGLDVWCDPTIPLAHIGEFFY